MRREAAVSSQEIRLNEDGNQYEAWVDGTRAGVLQFSQADGVITYEHTIVDDDFAGQGIGSQLVRRALVDARENNWKVVAQCPFVAAYFGRHPAESDLLLID